MARRGHRRSGEFKKNLISVTALAGLTVLAPPALAQTGAPVAGDSIETVIVTARARSEDIEKVPAQVTAFTAEDIQAMGIEKPADFLSAVPNVTFISTQNAGTSFIVIRGISQARNSEPSVAIVVDGVPMTQPAEFNQSLLDIQQIEVLKAPRALCTVATRSAVQSSSRRSSPGISGKNSSRRVTTTGPAEKSRELSAVRSRTN